MDESIHPEEDHHPEQFYENLHDKVALYELYFILWHWFEKRPEVTYRNYRQYIKNWEVFSYLHLADILTEKQGKINISAEQRNILEHYTVQQMENMISQKSQRFRKII